MEREERKTILTIEEMLNAVIRRYGFEVKQTIDFSWLCVYGKEKEVRRRFEKLMREV